MKHSNIKLFGLIFFLIFYTCNNDDDCACAGQIYGKWEVKEFMSIESVLYAKNDGFNPIIQFKQDGTISIRLDANICSSTFDLLSDTELNITDAGCTKICCDSDFSMKFLEMLPQVESYEIEHDELKLHVSSWGWMELEYISD